MPETLTPDSYMQTAGASTLTPDAYMAQQQSVPRETSLGPIIYGKNGKPMVGWDGGPLRGPALGHGFVSDVLPQTIFGKYLGGSDIAEGLSTLQQPGVDPKFQAAHQIATGAGKLALPFMLPAAAEWAAANVLPAAAATAGAIGGQKLASTAAEAFGAGPGVSNVVGDVTGLATGALGSKLAPSNETMKRLWAVRGDPDLQEAMVNLIPGGFGTKVRKVGQAYRAANDAMSVPAPPKAETQPAAPSNAPPKDVDPRLWGKLSPEHQAKLRQSIEGTAPAPLAVPPPPGVQPTTSALPDLGGTPRRLYNDKSAYEAKYPGADPTAHRSVWSHANTDVMAQDLFKRNVTPEQVADPKVFTEQRWQQEAKPFFKQGNLSKESRQELYVKLLKLHNRPWLPTGTELPPPPGP